MPMKIIFKDDTIIINTISYWLSILGPLGILISYPSQLPPQLFGIFYSLLFFIVD